MHAQLSVVPATATVADVRDYFAASTHRRLAVLVADDGVYVGALAPAHLSRWHECASAPRLLRHDGA